MAPASCFTVASHHLNLKSSALPSHTPPIRACAELDSCSGAKACRSAISTAAFSPGLVVEEGLESPAAIRSSSTQLLASQISSFASPVSSCASECNACQSKLDAVSRSGGWKDVLIHKICWSSVLASDWAPTSNEQTAHDTVALMYCLEDKNDKTLVQFQVSAAIDAPVLQAARCLDSSVLVLAQLLPSSERFCLRQLCAAQHSPPGRLAAAPCVASRRPAFWPSPALLCRPTHISHA